MYLPREETCQAHVVVLQLLASPAVSDSEKHQKAIEEQRGWYEYS